MAPLLEIPEEHVAAAAEKAAAAGPSPEDVNPSRELLVSAAEVPSLVQKA